MSTCTTTQRGAKPGGGAARDAAGTQGAATSVSKPTAVDKGAPSESTKALDKAQRRTRKLAVRHGID